MTIKVLVVDDNTTKIAKIVKALSDAGVAREAIDVCQTGSDARDKLEAAQYDLLLLDIVLPHRAEDTANAKVGVGLLKDITDKQEFFNRPRQIVGLTQFEDVQKDLVSLFADQLWLLVHCDEFSDGWMEKIRKLARYLLGVSAETEGHRYKTDLCVVTALADPELKALMALPWNWRESDPIDSCTFPYEGHITIRETSFSVVAATANKAGLTATTVLTSKLLHIYRPRVIALIGICAGVRGKTNLGDVVLGSPAWDWQRGKVVADEGKNKVLIEPIQIPIPSYVDTEYQRLAKDAVAVSKIKSSWQARAPDTSLQLRSGPLATGGLVIAAGGGMDVIRGQHRNLTAVDMETYGVYGAAMYGPDPRPTFMSIKGVSDYGEQDKDDQWQSYAAFASAHVLSALIERSHATLFRMAGRI